jgi:hypothetical protein
MRESRTYGSVRGACDETHVPTATRFSAVQPTVWPRAPKERQREERIGFWLPGGAPLIRCAVASLGGRVAPSSGALDRVAEQRRFYPTTSSRHIAIGTRRTGSDPIGRPLVRQSGSELGSATPAPLVEPCPDFRQDALGSRAGCFPRVSPAASGEAARRKKRIFRGFPERFTSQRLSCIKTERFQPHSHPSNGRRGSHL